MEPGAGVGVRFLQNTISVSNKVFAVTEFFFISTLILMNVELAEEGGGLK